MPFVNRRSGIGSLDKDKDAGLLMTGVRPMEIVAQAALSEQAPTSSLHNYFRMAELYTNLK